MKIHNDHRRTTPIGLIKYAREFFDAALAADDKIGHRPGFEIIAPVPVMYLVGHSIELALKSYLVHEGVPLDDLPTKKYGHNLEKCLASANQLGLLNIVKFEEGEIDALKVLNELFSTKQLNYIVSGAKTFPVFGPIQTFCQKLLDGVGPYVKHEGQTIQLT